MVYISIKGYTGKFNCQIIAFYKENIELLKEKVKNIYKDEVNFNLPSYFWEIETIKKLKEFVKTELVPYIDNYPYGFKHIDGVYCLYQAY